MDILDTLCVQPAANSDEQTSNLNGTSVAASDGNIPESDSRGALCETLHSEKVADSAVEHQAEEQISKPSSSNQSDNVNSGAISSEDCVNNENNLYSEEVKEKHLPKVDMRGTDAGEGAKIDLNNATSEVPVSSLAEKLQVGGMIDREKSEDECEGIAGQTLRVENSCTLIGKSCSSSVGEIQDSKFSPVENKSHLNKSEDQASQPEAKQLLTVENFDGEKNDLLSLIDREESLEHGDGIEMKCSQKEDIISKYNEESSATQNVAQEPLCESTVHSESSNLEYAAEVKPVVKDALFTLQSEEDGNSREEKRVPDLEKGSLECCCHSPVKSPAHFSSLQDKDKFAGEKGVLCAKEKHCDESKCTVTRESSKNSEQSQIILPSKMEDGAKETETSVLDCDVKTKQNIPSSLKNCSSNKENNVLVLNKRDPYAISSSEEEPSQERYKPLKRRLGNLKDRCYADSVFFENVNEFHETEKDLAESDASESKRKRPSGRVMYIYSDELLEKTNGLSRIEGRAELIHSLIQTYGLLPFLSVKNPRPATEEEILGFHSSDYIKFLQECSDAEEDVNPEAEGYGLSYDCPLQKSIFTTASLISGGTIVAAEAVMNNEADIAINWFGGWHHAKRDSASGFCYINDIVLGILKLREKYERILYVDIDLHHGDGVEEAFSMTNKVMTVSFHKYVPGFFPGSGSVDHTGEGKGKFYTLNVPLLDGIKDAQFFFIFNKIMDQVKVKFQPQVIVIQCGADGLSEDPMVSFNLTHIGLARCVCSLLAWNMPTVLLGGGGYNFPNTAKCWTLLTALAAGKRLPMDIPEHEHFLEYGPTYDLSTRIGNRKDCNTVEYLKQLLSKIYRNLSNI